MAGQHIEREARYTKSGLTTAQRDELIWKLATEKKWSQREIARKLEMTQAGVSFALKRMRGEQRNRTKTSVCDACCEDVPTDQLVDGLCPTCQDALQDL